MDCLVVSHWFFENVCISCIYSCISLLDPSILWCIFLSDPLRRWCDPVSRYQTINFWTVKKYKSNFLETLLKLKPALSNATMSPLIWKWQIERDISINRYIAEYISICPIYREKYIVLLRERDTLNTSCDTYDYNNINKFVLIISHFFMYVQIGLMTFGHPCIL